MKNVKWILVILCLLVMVSTSHAYDLNFCRGKISYIYDQTDNTLAVDGPHECRQEMLVDGYWRAMNHFGQYVIVQYDYYLKPVAVKGIRQAVARYDVFTFSQSKIGEEVN